jgi:hypothetical protein
MIHDLQTKLMKPMPFLCTNCQAHPAWYSRGQLVVMGCSCGSIALDYDKLPVIPQNEHEWRALLSDWPGMREQL